MTSAPPIALHIACLPFPTYQGTQAAVASMVRASLEAGIETHLVTYAHGLDIDVDATSHHRVAVARIGLSLRSGPTLSKLVHDFAMVREVRKLAQALQPTWIVAHHVEAAWVAQRAGVQVTHFIAHTSLSDELRTYSDSAWLHPLANRIGARIDKNAASAASQCFAVAPHLAVRLSAATLRPFSYVRVPWTTVAPTQGQRRNDELEAPEILYAGNLDEYQGWEDVIGAVRLCRAKGVHATAVIASDSDPAPARAVAKACEIEHAITFESIRGESQRQMLHERATLAVVPRRVEGGVSVKLLDALSRGTATVASTRAVGGLPVGEACITVSGNGPAPFAAAITQAISSPETLLRLRTNASAYVTTNHRTFDFVSDLHGDRILG